MFSFRCLEESEKNFTTVLSVDKWSKERSDSLLLFVKLCWTKYQQPSHIKPSQHTKITAKKSFSFSPYCADVRVKKTWFFLCSVSLWVSCCLMCVFLSLSVCVTFLGKFYQSLKDNDVKFNSADIEKAIIKTCKDVKGKENRFVSKTQTGRLI